ncbi:MAG TPA: hypothetical protein VHH72_09255 [Solirubrobacterales bacterium]|nr:hypothetical protein [Solirubrobacterales bacterium]
MARPPLNADDEIIHAEWGSVSSRMSDEERLALIEAEVRRGFEALAELGPAVCVFGSARTAEGDPDYELARRTGSALAEAGFAVITGGGRGRWRPPTAEPRRPAGCRSASTSICRTSRR